MNFGGVNRIRMKIPETSANVGAYYGSEENTQWQPNGVIIDSGVGGGVVGSGDAGVHRPPVYPLHIPRGHIPGYVMAGAYYPAPYPAAATSDDFADYMWMEHEEEFDKQVMQQLEEEALMEQCIEAMLEDEQRERTRPTNGHGGPTTSTGAVSLEEAVSRSTLNPLAAEFVPTRRQPPAESSSDKPQVPTEEPPTEPVAAEEPPATETPVEDNHIEEAPQPEPPEVSAADVAGKKDKKEKRPAKADKRAKPSAAKSDTKVQQTKKKEVKIVKSEVKVSESAPPEDSPAAPADHNKPQPAPTEEAPLTGPKPINYAAAAKANKPRKPSTPPNTEKTPSPTERGKPKTEKAATKPDKSVARKNSTK